MKYRLHLSQLLLYCIVSNIVIVVTNGVHILLHSNIVL